MPTHSLEGIDAGRVLSTLADQADARLTATIKARTGKDRWTLTRDDQRIPEIRAAIQAKYAADGAWLGYMRWRQEQGIV